jgi:hypothetical protein
MRRCVPVTWLLLGVLIAAGCSMTPDIILRNSAGETARCEGFFVASGWGRSRLLHAQQRECVADYQRQGFERAPVTPGKD